MFFKLKKKNFAKGLDRTVLTGSCGPTPVLTVHEINKKSGSLGLKNRFSSQFPVFTVRPSSSVRFWKPCFQVDWYLGRFAGGWEKLSYTSTCKIFHSWWRLHIHKLHMLQEIDCVQPLHKMLGFRCWHILCNKIKG